MLVHLTSLKALQCTVLYISEYKQKTHVIILIPNLTYENYYKKKFFIKNKKG